MGRHGKNDDSKDFEGCWLPPVYTLLITGLGFLWPYESNSQWARSAAPITENPDVRHFVCERFEDLWSCLGL